MSTPHKCFPTRVNPRTLQITVDRRPFGPCSRSGPGEPEGVFGARSREAAQAEMGAPGCARVSRLEVNPGVASAVSNSQAFCFCLLSRRRSSAGFQSVSRGCRKGPRPMVDVVASRRSRPVWRPLLARNNGQAAPSLLQNKDGLATDRLVEADEAWHVEGDALFGARRDVVADHACDGEDGIELLCSARRRMTDDMDRELSMPAAKVGGNGLAAGDAASEGGKAPQTGDGKRPAAHRAAVGSSMHKRAEGAAGLTAGDMERPGGFDGYRRTVGRRGHIRAFDAPKAVPGVGVVLRRGGTRRAGTDQDEA